MKLIRPRFQSLFAVATLAAVCAGIASPPPPAFAGPPAPPSKEARGVVPVVVAFSMKGNAAKKQGVPGAAPGAPKAWYAATEKDQAHPRALAPGRCALASGGFVKCANGASVTLLLGARRQVYNVPNKWLELPFLTGAGSAPIRNAGQGPGTSVGGGKTPLPFGGRMRNGVVRAGVPQSGANIGRRISNRRPVPRRSPSPKP